MPVFCVFLSELLPSPPNVFHAASLKVIPIPIAWSYWREEWHYWSLIQAEAQAHHGCGFETTRSASNSWLDYKLSRRDIQVRGYMPGIAHHIYALKQLRVSNELGRI